MKNHSYIITKTENKKFWQFDITKIATAIVLSDTMLGDTLRIWDILGYKRVKKIFLGDFSNKNWNRPSRTKQ